LSWIAFPNARVLHPNSAAALIGSEPEELECAPSPAADSALDGAKPSRATPFSQLGSYACARPIFRSDERNPFYDALFRVEAGRLKRVAEDVRGRLAGEDKVFVRARPAPGESFAGQRDEQALALVAAMYRVELEQALGPGRVARAPNAPYALNIEVYKVDARDFMSHAVLARTLNGAQAWQEK
jgi:hypothetical protein